MEPTIGDFEDPEQLWGVFIPWDDKVQWVKMDADRYHRSADWMRDQLDVHTFDVIRLGDGIDMWVDDEGSFRPPHEMNLTARRIVAHWLDVPVSDIVSLRGHALILGVDSNGTTISPDPAELLKRVEDMAKVV